MTDPERDPWPSVGDDERPFGWMRCSVCGEDCEEQDYNEQTRTSTHRECLDENVYCLKHGKHLFSEGGSYCEDCEPPEPDYDAMTATERAGLEREQMAYIQRHLK